MTKLSIHFDLPFYLKISGSYNVKIDDKVAEVTLTERKKKQTTMPGLSEAKNIELVFDDTPHFRYTEVKIDIELQTPAPTKEETDYFTLILIPDISLRIANKVIEVYRHISDEFIIPELTDTSQIVNFNFEIHDKETFPNQMGGGIVLRFDRKIGLMQADLEESKIDEIKSILSSGEEVPLSRKLFLDARMYQKRRDVRLALMNLSLSFEVFLVELVDDNLAKVMSATGLPEDKINKWTMNDLATSGIKVITGHSLEKEQFWSKDIVNGYKQILKIRNIIMHKGYLRIILDNNSTLNLNDPIVLDEQFKIVKKLFNKIKSVT